MQKLKGRKILLCEDHPLNAEIARKLLERAACEVVWAEDGCKGLEIYKESSPHEYDLILMDIRMPRMDGLETARAIRALSRSDARAIPIIAMTANAYEEDRHNSTVAGMDAHLAKPINPAQMYHTMVEVLERDSETDML